MSNISGMTILVTGAGGFIGSHLVEHLALEGVNIRAMVKYNSQSSIGMLKHLPENVLAQTDIISGNVCDPFFVNRAVQDCDYVFHLAALIGIPYSYIAPSDYLTVNAMGTINILEACRRHKTKRLIITSTSEVYGSAQYIPINEKHPLQGQSPYSASKIAADKMTEAYSRSFDMPVTIVRPFNTFGPRQSARAFIPTIICQLLTGNILHIGNMDTIRDLTYVEDTVKGFIKVGLHNDTIGMTVNLGTGQGHTIESVVKMIQSIMNKKDVSITQDADRIRPEKSEVRQLVSDNAIAQKLCSWLPERSLREGLEETIKWIEANLTAFNPDEYIV